MPGVGPKELDDIGTMVECFPPIQTVISLVQRRCGCPRCKERAKPGKGKLGCLAELAITTLFTLIGHIIADGFGVPYASGFCNPEALKLVVAKMLRQIALHQQVYWDNWFAVAASVYLGCDWSKLDIKENAGATNVVAIQYGSLVAVANWLDIMADNPVTGCFGIVVEDAQLAGVLDEFATLQAEMNPLDPVLAIETLSDAGKPLFREDFVPF